MLFDDFWSTVFGSTFFLTRRAASLENVGFPLVLQGIPYGFASAPLGGQQMDRFPSRATLGEVLGPHWFFAHS